MSDMNGRMELHHLRCVVAIADHGTFTDAAAALYVSQPALSHAVARLERELGSRLFYRSSEGARLTPAGNAFLGPARRALTEVTNSQAAVGMVVGVLSGELHVTSVRTAMTETAQLVSSFHRRHPGVHVLIEEPTSDWDVIGAVRTAKCHVGIIHSTETPTDLREVIIGQQEIVAVFPEAVAPPAETVTLERLCEVPLVAPLPGTRARQRHDALFQDLAKRPNVVAECSDDGTAFELVRGRMGARLISGTRLKTMDTKGVAIRAIRPSLSPHLAAIRRPELSPAVDALWAILGDPSQMRE